MPSAACGCDRSAECDSAGIGVPARGLGGVKLAYREYGGPESHVPGYRLEEMTKLIPDCRLVTLPVGHRVHLSDPDRFAELVLTFLASEPVAGVC